MWDERMSWYYLFILINLCKTCINFFNFQNVVVLLIHIYIFVQNMYSFFFKFRPTDQFSLLVKRVENN